MSKFGEVCEHGSLKRKCLTCELNDEIALLQEQLKLADALREAAEAQQLEAMKIIRNRGFIFAGKGGKWEKLAFTFYTMLVELKDQAEAFRAARGSK